jgi:hypothetical protein
MRMSSVVALPESHECAPLYAITFHKIEYVIHIITCVFILYTFSGSTFDTSMFTLGKMVLISNVTRQHYVIFMGNVTSFTSVLSNLVLVYYNNNADTTVVISVDRQPRMDIRNDEYRIDWYSSVTSFQLTMSNIARLMTDDDKWFVVLFEIYFFCFQCTFTTFDYSI